jgi:two-component system OmpR family response regulator
MSPAPAAACESVFVEPPACGAILLVEDDDIVAGLVARILARRSKRVLRAANGAEGEKLFAENRTDIALAILDCWLPDLDGTVLCRRLRREAPALPVLLTSGCDNAEALRLATEDRTAFLAKPFYPSQVDRQVSALLGAAPR